MSALKNNSTASNGTGTASGSPQDIFSPSVAILIDSLYIIITLTGFFGNILICYIVLKRKVRRTAFNLLLMNLSFSDLMADIFCYPYIFIDLKKLDGSQRARNAACSLTIGLTPFFICTSVSLMTLAIISINRYIIINHPLKVTWQTSSDGAKFMITATWVLGIIILIPNFFSFEHIEYWGICRRHWPSTINGTVYSTATTVLGLVIPIIIFTFSFIATVKGFRNKIHDQLSAYSNRAKSRKRVILLLGALIAAFFICWGPFFVYWFVSRSTSLFPPGNDGEYERMKFVRITILIALCNTLADPILYAFLSDEYRKVLTQIFGKPGTFRLFSSVRYHGESYALTTLEAGTCTRGSRKHTADSRYPSSSCLKALDEEVKEKLPARSLEAMNIIRQENSSHSDETQS